MKRILCFGDSNTWGYDPTDVDERGINGRYPEHVRWTGVMGDLLGADYRVIEEGLNGRTTVFENPTLSGRNGDPALEVAAMSHAPLDCVILMLGTNDANDMFNACAEVIGYGMERLLRTWNYTLSFTRSAQAKIVIACPLKITPMGSGEYIPGLTSRCTEVGERLRTIYRQLAERYGCAFIDVNDYVTPSPVDGIHLSAESHRILGETMADFVRKLLEE